MTHLKSIKQSMEQDVVSSLNEKIAGVQIQIRKLEKAVGDINERKVLLSD